MRGKTPKVIGTSKMRLLKKSLDKVPGTKGHLATVSTPKISAGNRGVTMNVPLKNPIADHVCLN
jgi:hypothetical protein